jgi:hypothetical protein
MRIVAGGHSSGGRTVLDLAAHRCDGDGDGDGEGNDDGGRWTTRSQTEGTAA